MSVRDIPRGDWVAFLAEFSRRHLAWLATVQRLPPDAPPHTEVIERPLHSVAFTVEAPDEGCIEIRFQEDSRERETVRIDAPLKIGVDETGQHTERGLQIIDRNGECTQIRFRAAPPPEALNGVAPGELP